MNMILTWRIDSWIGSSLVVSTQFNNILSLVFSIYYSYNQVWINKFIDIIIPRLKHLAIGWRHLRQMILHQTETSQVLNKNHVLLTLKSTTLVPIKWRHMSHPPKKDFLWLLTLKSTTLKLVADTKINHTSTY